MQQREIGLLVYSLHALCCFNLAIQTHSACDLNKAIPTCSFFVILLQYTTAVYSTMQNSLASLKKYSVMNTFQIHT